VAAKSPDMSALPDGTGPLWVRAGADRGVLVYPKPDHVPASFTVLNLSVPDIAAAVDDLQARGITFQRYPEYHQDARGIYHGESTRSPGSRTPPATAFASSSSTTPMRGCRRLLGRQPSACWVCF